MSGISSRYDWVFNDILPKFTKEEIARLYITKTLIRTQKMFKYENLPKTIPQKDLELLLQVNGSAVITKVKGELYAMRGGLGGEPNAYYLPTIAVVANPYLKYDKELVIDKDCVVILNDALYEGLMPLIKHNSYLLAEADISFKFACINSRIPSLISAKDDDTLKSAKEFFKQIEDGTSLGIVADESFVENNIGAYNYAQSQRNIQDLIELKQYIWGSFLVELGIQSSFNMKREAINEAEASLDTDILYPLIDDMLNQRKEGIKKVNDMFGTNISVELDSVWQQLREQQDLQMAVLENEANDTSVVENASADGEKGKSEDKKDETKGSV